MTDSRRFISLENLDLRTTGKPEDVFFIHGFTRLFTDDCLFVTKKQKI